MDVRAAYDHDEIVLFVCHPDWRYIDFDDYTFLLEVLEHEIIHAAIEHLRLSDGANSSLDLVLNGVPCHRPIPFLLFGEC